MRGKVGFVLGAALGYVLGTRAGRARYEQIKRGATAVWETPLVQQRVETVKEAVNEGIELGKSAAAQLAKNAFAAATQQNGNRQSGTRQHTRDSSHAHGSGSPASSTSDSATSASSTQSSSARGATSSESSQADTAEEKSE